MNGWFGDGNGYTGTLDVRPEVAHTLSATAGWHDAAKKGWELTVTPYLTRVQNYIDVERCPVIADGSDGCTAGNLTARSGFVTLAVCQPRRPAVWNRRIGTRAAGRLHQGGRLCANGCVKLRSRSESRYRRQPLPHDADARRPGVGAPPGQLVQRP
jgi:hypothetical protein